MITDTTDRDTTQWISHFQNVINSGNKSKAKPNTVIHYAIEVDDGELVIRAHKVYMRRDGSSGKIDQYHFRPSVKPPSYLTDSDITILNLMHNAYERSYYIQSPYVDSILNILSEVKVCLHDDIRKLVNFKLGKELHASLDWEPTDNQQYKLVLKLPDHVTLFDSGQDFYYIKIKDDDVKIGRVGSDFNMSVVRNMLNLPEYLMMRCRV